MRFLGAGVMRAGTRVLGVVLEMARCVLRFEERGDGTDAISPSRSSNVVRSNSEEEGAPARLRAGATWLDGPAHLTFLGSRSRPNACLPCN